MEDRPNLKVLKPSRKWLKEGDIFVLQPDDQYLFGRVIKIGTLGGFTNSVLIYIFRSRSASKEVPSRLSPDNLLIPPIITTRWLWSRGYFETVAQIPLELRDVLKQHCFRSTRGRYYGEEGKELPGPVEPVGAWGVTTIRGIDNKISDALGMPRAFD